MQGRQGISQEPGDSAVLAGIQGWFRAQVTKTCLGAVYDFKPFLYIINSDWKDNRITDSKWVFKKELSFSCSFVFFLVITPSHTSNQANGFPAFSAAKHTMKHSPSCKKIEDKGNNILHLLGKWDTEIWMPWFSLAFKVGSTFVWS